MPVESAAAKVNLTLEVVGRRRDGYHELKSLVVFAPDAADVLTSTKAYSDVAVSGPFATAIVGSNLAVEALRALRASAPELAEFGIALEKNLPVASGIGGGSADAAAVLRLARSVDPLGSASLELDCLARGLGADVPVCLASRAMLVTGAGESLSPVTFPAGLAVLLVNPLVDVPADKTARVFEALAAPPLSAGARERDVPLFAAASDVIAFAVRSRNDLQPVAESLFPEVGTVLRAIGGTIACRLARLSGAGPTCFGLYDSIAAARSAAAALTAAHPEWWIVPSRIA